MKPLKSLNKYILRYKSRLLLGIVFVTISNFFAVAQAPLVGAAIDSIIADISVIQLFDGMNNADDAKNALYGNLLFFCALILVAAILKGVFLFFTRQTIIVMSRLIEYDLKNDIFDQYQKLPLSFYRRNNTGDLMNRISEDVSKVRMYLGPAIMYGINLVIICCLVIGIMLNVNKELTLYVLLPLPVLSISIYYVSNKMNLFSEQIQRKQSDLSTFVQEAFSGIRVIKAFAREQHTTELFDQESSNYKKRALKLGLINAFFFPLILFLIGLSTILTVYIGGIEVLNDQLSIGAIAQFVMYLYLLTWPVTSVGWVTSIVQRASASQQRINEFLQEKTDLISEKNLTSEVHGKIEFKNVDFIYPESGIKALSNVSLSIESGKTLAIVGTTGSGKSTLANLITRLSDVTSGEVLIDGINVKDYSISYLREQIGYVPQDVFLFSDTIENNIGFGISNVDRDLIINAAKEAYVHENIIAFEKGYESLIGERGITLSGGQKQRLSLARAIIKRPKILLLDDSLSAVDTKTEDHILKNLVKIMKNRTTVLISHRVSTVKMADTILVMDEGRIVEQGTHQELLSKHGAYKELYEMQQEQEETKKP